MRFYLRVILRQSEDIMDKRKVKPLILNQWFLFISLDLLRKSIMMEKDFQESEMFVIRDNGKIIAAAVVNESVNDEYSQVDWDIKDEDAKIATIHALATDPEYRGHSVSDMFFC